MADFNIPISRRHAEGHTALEALLTTDKEWGYDETNDELCVRVTGGSYKYHSRHKLYALGTDTAAVSADASGNVTTGPLTVTSTTSPQASIRYDANNYGKISVSNTGLVEIESVRSSGIKLVRATNSALQAYGTPLGGISGIYGTNFGKTVETDQLFTFLNDGDCIVGLYANPANVCKITMRDDEGTIPAYIEYNHATDILTLSATSGIALSGITAAASDTDKFLVSDGGVIKYRTGAEVLSDIGGTTDHGSLSGLSDDDHTQYLLVDGTRAMTGNFLLGSHTISNNGTGGFAFDTSGNVTFYNNLLVTGSGQFNSTFTANASSTIAAGSGAVLTVGDTVRLNQNYIQTETGTGAVSLTPTRGQISLVPGADSGSTYTLQAGALSDGQFLYIVNDDATYMNGHNVVYAGGTVYLEYQEVATFFRMSDSWFLLSNPSPTLDSIAAPTANHIITMANKTLTWRFTNPSGGVFYEWTGAASGHLFELNQNTGNPGAGTHILHIESTDADVDHIHCELPSGGGGYALLIDQTGDTYNRMQIDDDGKVEWGSGSGAVDTNLYRTSSNVLKTDDSLEVAGDIYTTALTDYSGTTTVTGIDGTTTVRVRYKKIGKTVIVHYYLYGDGDGTTLSLTLPFACGSQNVGEYHSIQYVNTFDNSAYAIGQAFIGTTTSTLSFRPREDLTSWTNDTTREVSGTFIYETA